MYVMLCSRSVVINILHCSYSVIYADFFPGWTTLTNHKIINKSKSKKLNDTTQNYLSKRRKSKLKEKK